ncbi:MAG: hypothetical protein HON47_05025, partial [Candidatus Diapherotrites archaeon]|nr:hypothetical protein [Candidatus Diapherotrites archaeon]
KFDLINQTLKKASFLSFTFLTILGIILFVLAEIIVAIFVPGELEVIANTATFIKLMALSFGLLGIMTVMIGSIRGAGDTKKAMVLSILLLLFQIIFAATLPIWFGVTGLWLSFPGAIILTFFIALYYAIKMNWKKSRLI